MNSLEEFHVILREYFKEVHPKLGQLYNWKSPAFGDIKPTGANACEQALSLRRQLSKRWAHADRDEKLAIANFYVRDWGGIKANDSSRIEFYALATPDAIIKAGFPGISSWSKVLAVADPDRYAIYDSRVAFQLNRIQLERLGKLAVYFSMPPGRPSGWDAEINRIKAARSEVDTKPGRREVYPTYLKAIASAAGQQPIELVEMSLFAGARTPPAHA